ncbi:MAG: hypothetical protein F2813_04755, partial [Actinobacteria bacterium]|nr:hypothetical protein [Actinomycetota bacterium]
KHVTRRVLRGSTATDWSVVRWIGPLRTTIVATAAVSIGIAIYGPTGAFPFAVGSLFVGLADQRGDFDERVRGLVVAGVLVTVATFIGVSVSGSFLAHIVVAGIFAAFCGYIGLAGPRAALAGVVALVAFTAFSGTPEPLSAVLPTTLKVLVSAVVMATVIAAPMLAGRLGGLRTDVVVTLRAQAFALRGLIGGIDGTNVASKLVAARSRVAASGCYGQTLEWFEQMLSDTEAMRFGFFALHGALDERDRAQQERVEQFKLAAGELLMTLASALEIPASRRRIGPALGAFNAAAGACGEGLGPRSAVALARIKIAAHSLSQSVSGRWPIGRHCQFSRRLRAPIEPISKLLHRRDPGSVFTRHAIRVSGLIVLATGIAQLDPLDHSFWIPLTVAWITKPDFAGTTMRVAQRVLGTAIGVIASVLLVDLIGSTVPLEVVMFAAGAMITVAFLAANYTVCTVGVTIWLMALLDIGSAPTGARVLQTLAAGLLVMAASRIWPTRTSSQAAAGLADLATALRNYCTSIMGVDRTERTETRAMMLAASLKATTVVEESGHEPGRHLIHYDYALQIDEDLRAATAIAASFDELDESGQGLQLASPRSEITESSLSSLDHLAVRLRAVQESGVVTLGDGHGHQTTTPFERLVSEADRQLDELAVYRQRVSVAARN